MKTYAIVRYDGKMFPERFESMEEAHEELRFKLGIHLHSGLAWIVELLTE